MLRRMSFTLPLSDIHHLHAADLAEGAVVVERAVLIEEAVLQARVPVSLPAVAVAGISGSTSGIYRAVLQASRVWAEL